MALFALILFVLNLSLLFVHEMDAARNAEWRMFAGFRRLNDPAGYRLFTALHIPLYAFIIYLLLGGYAIAAYYIIDIFLIIHTALHVLFRGHGQNGMKSLFSQTIIYAMGLISAGHLAMWAWW